jgi:hypothetical protein
MSQRAATIESLPAAFEMVKAMQADGLEWGEGYRPLARQAIAEIIEQQMAQALEAHLEQLAVFTHENKSQGLGTPFLLLTHKN